jgi:hypothetical protein
MKERISPLLIPTLLNVEKKEIGEDCELTFTRTLLLPCNLSFSLLTPPHTQF